MPCRSGAPDVAIRNPAAASPPTTVRPVQPMAGCAATPTGLSTTTKASSSWTILIPGTGSATTSTGRWGSGMMMSSRSPAVTRSDLITGRPDICTPPSAQITAAAVRDRPSSFDIAATTDCPPSPSGTRMERSVMGVFFHTWGVRSVDVDALEAGHDERDRSRGDRDVGDIADEQRQIDEVDDGSVQERRCPEQTVDEVAEQSAQQQAEPDGPGARGQFA